LSCERLTKEDREIVEALRQGRPGAFAALHGAYLDRVFGYTVRRLTSREDAEDVTCEVFAACVSSINKLRNDTLLVPWLLGIARRKIVDHRRRSRSRETPVSDCSPVEGFDIYSELPDDVFCRVEVVDAVRSAMARLPESQREALLLHHGDGLSLREAALVMNRSEDSVKALLRRGRTGLAALLDGGRAVGVTQGGMENAPEPKQLPICRGELPQ
jgi:RNA polymerase sigma-70 factor (ECF subfamily)